MKRTMMLIFVIALAFCLTACGCEHEWSETTCTTPKTCKLCGKTEGTVGALHHWLDATCLAPKTCKDCGTTEGDIGDHVWKEATCTAAKTCETCGATEGEALGHQWVDPTCTEAKSCSVCSAKEGEALGHKNSHWKTEKKPSCSEPGSETSVCSTCQEKITREIPMVEHKPGKWQVQVHATLTTPGLETQFCTVCEQLLEGRNYELPPLDIKPLKGKNNFKYDEFTKSWKYYKTYTKTWSNATENIMIILFSEDNSNLIEDIELRAFLHWKDGTDIWLIKTVELMVGDKIYACQMTSEEGKELAYSFLATDTSYQMIQDIAAANKVKAKITYTNGSTQELDVGTQLKGICSDIVNYDLWYYYTPGILENLDTTTVR